MTFFIMKIYIWLKNFCHLYRS